MIVLTEHNIEEYIINSIEHLLTPVEEAALQQYILMHPEAHTLYDEYSKTILAPEAHIVFPFKENLFKHTATITQENIDECIISSIEKLLTPEEEQTLQQYIQTSPTALQLYMQYQKTVLVPTPVVYPYKNALYKQEIGNRPIPMRTVWMRVAAVLVLALSVTGAWRWMANNSAQNSTEQDTAYMNSMVYPTNALEKAEEAPPLVAQLKKHTTQPVAVMHSAKVNTNFDAEARAAIIRRQQATEEATPIALVQHTDDSYTPLPQAQMAQLHGYSNRAQSRNHNTYTHTTQNNGGTQALMASYTEGNSNVQQVKDVATTTVRALSRLTGHHVDETTKPAINAVHISYTGRYVNIDKTINIKQP